MSSRVSRWLRTSNSSITLYLGKMKEKWSNKQQHQKNQRDHNYTAQLWNRSWQQILGESVFGGTWIGLPIFLLLTPVAVAPFPAFGTGRMFPRVWQRLHVFPRIAPIACFPTLKIGWIFPLLAPVVWFPALEASRLFLLSLLIEFISCFA